ncbi:winged helix-turn-helix domain-containing protein [Rhodoligotrophos appendicifer]|uniref:winged helix-turn-helix domain-containing protein n=1 Tax=Rhodoligotrophos appendicifer TaxID=987056 RepID=UPI0011854546
MSDPSLPPTTRLTQAQARRIALAAQGFARPLPARDIARRDLLRVFDHVGLIQIDSVNVLVRSHFLPGFSRLGPYQPKLLEDLAYGRRRQLFEYWGHEASLIPLHLYPLMRWRMARAAEGRGIYGGLARFAGEKAAYIEQVYEEVAQRGPLGGGELSDESRGEGGWWGWSDGKKALEFLFWSGRITTAARRNFERLYDLTERVIPADILSLPVPSAAAAQRGLLEISARAMGIATERDLRDYFRLDTTETKLRLLELVEEGVLQPVEVKGWRDPAYLHKDARIPRKIRAQALLTPFDSLVWHRDRAHRLFDFHYRLEIYTPAEKRIHGYYVLPFLLGDRLVARVDLKSDRALSSLRVQGVHCEEDVSADEVLAPLAVELRRLSSWLGLSEVVVSREGELAEGLRTSLGRATAFVPAEPGGGASPLGQEEGFGDEADLKGTPRA